MTQTQPITGNVSEATGPDPNRTFRFRYKVLELNDLIASHDATVAVNPKFPKELQPRIRDRQASRQQVSRIAKDLNPEALLTDLAVLDRGPMIVGPDNVVESGNGRTIALQLAALDFPEQYAKYKAALTPAAEKLGFTKGALAQFEQPVLVRERTSEVNRVEFATLANQAAVLAMSPLEQALADAGRLNAEDLASLTVTDTQSIDQALKSPANLKIVRSFLNGLPANEQAALVSSDGSLNQIGLQRVKAAIFAKVFPGASGQRLTQTFFESIDPTIKNTEAALFDALPKLAQAEGLVAKGDRVADLAVGDDLARVVDVFARLKQENIPVSDFLAQSGMFERELNPAQENLLIFFNDAGRSRKRTRGLLQGYADTVIASPHPNQATMFAAAQENKGEILGRIIEAQLKEAKGETLGLFGLAQARAEQEAFSKPQEIAAARASLNRPQLERSPEVAKAVATPTVKEKVEAIKESQASRRKEIESRTPSGKELLLTRADFLTETFLFPRDRNVSRTELQSERLLQSALNAAEAANEVALTNSHRSIDVVQSLFNRMTKSEQGSFIELIPDKHIPFFEKRQRARFIQEAEARLSTPGPKLLTPRPVREKGEPTKAVSLSTAGQAFQGRSTRSQGQDIRRTSKLVAPTKAETEKDKRLQQRWLRNPGRMDFQGVDTKRKGFGKSKGL